MWRILLRTLLWSSAVGQKLAGMSLRRLPVIAKAILWRLTYRAGSVTVSKKRQ